MMKGVESFYCYRTKVLRLINSNNKNTTSVMWKLKYPVLRTLRTEPRLIMKICPVTNFNHITNSGYIKIQLKENTHRVYTIL